MTAPETVRRTVIVDCESTGLTDDAIAVEVAWWDIDSGEFGEFIPPHDVQWVLDNIHPKADELNGYRERLAGKPQDDGSEVRRLHYALRGQTIGGANVYTDCDWLRKMFRQAGLPAEPWHYRFGVLGPYASGALGRPFSAPFGLESLCVELGIEPEPKLHTAAGGARVTGLCVRELERRRVHRAALLAEPWAPSAAHLVLLANSQWRMSESEFGAPEIDGKRPYGNSSVKADLAELLPDLPPDERLKAHEELPQVLAWLSRHAGALIGAGR